MKIYNPGVLGLSKISEDLEILGKNVHLCQILATDNYSELILNSLPMYQNSHYSTLPPLQANSA
jgi:hypothetical protein